MKFETAVDIVIDRMEGGSKITDDPKDAGGLTKYGISLRAHPYLGRTGIRKLTRAQAIEIYRAKYWAESKAELLPAILRLPVFDSAVNQGRKASAVILQRALNDFRLRKKLDEDGIIGPLTLAAVKNLDAFELTTAYLYQRRLAYQSSKDYGIWGEGWEKRLIRISLLNKVNA